MGSLERVRVQPEGRLADVDRWLDATGECRVEFLDLAGDAAMETVSASRLIPVAAVGSELRPQVLNDCDVIVIESSASIDVDANATVWVVQTAQQTLRLFFQAGMRPRVQVAELSGAPMARFLQGLAQLRLAGWQESYRPTGYEVYDGYSWSVQIFGGSSMAAMKGENAHPDQLRALYDLLEQAGVPRIWDDAKDAPWFQG